jgi:uncharacterized 2Fe-2S/4Fe-4S cluster protein (DUF4445 family)
MRALPTLLRENDWTVRVGLRGDQVVSVTAPDVPLLGLAVDIGTTKVAGYLVDLTTGETLAMRGLMNPQIAYGEDVMARIAYTIEHQQGLQVLQAAIVDALNELARDLCTKGATHLDPCPSHIVEAVVVGNTAMHHLFLGLPVKQLGLAPYVAAVSSPLDVRATEIGLQLAPGATVHLLPNIAGFVGADHVSMLLATNAHQPTSPPPGRTEAPPTGLSTSPPLGQFVPRSEAQTGGTEEPLTSRSPGPPTSPPLGGTEGGAIILRLDIGTNTEITLAAAGRLIACSTASGPAFEGAHIRDGMRAAEGAIERVRITDGKLEYQTIGGGPPVGICGSGILDAIAQLKLAGALNHRGAMDPHHPLVRQGENGPEVVLAPAPLTRHGRDVLLNRKDVSEIQLSKGAMRAGIEILLQQFGLAADDIDRFIIAGAFGTYIDVASAVAIGMFPALPLERFRQVGNAAGIGAKLALLSSAQRTASSALAARVEYLELTNYPDFTNEFAKAMSL